MSAGRRLLKRALVAVRFSPVLKIAESSGASIAPFQEGIRHRYPVVELDQEKSLRVEVRPDGTVQMQPEEHPVWRILDIDRGWRVSLTTQSVALEVEASSYTTWMDFSQRLEQIIDATGEHFAPAQVLRIGVRYVNWQEINGEDDPRRECAPELVSITGGKDVIHSDLAWRFAADEGSVLLRSGLVQPGTSYDPGVFEPLSSPAWYLDIDAVNDTSAPFDRTAIKAAIVAQVYRVHAVYGWAMPPRGE